MINFGKPKTTTRVGVENQAKIPRLMEKHEPSELTCYGLPIPVTWVRNTKPKTSNENTIESATVDGELIPLPGLRTEPWSAIEHGSFLLGMYVFARKFSLVKRLIGSKRMRSVIGYYYRDFKKSDAHQKWSKWREAKLKRPGYARKLFTGWNHQELISRLSSNVTDECKDRLIKAGTKYIQGRLSLTRFIFALKENVGLNLLIEAVAIGQEDRDLLEFRPISDWSFVSVDVPIGKACSSHTVQEILKILKGDARLSKSRSSDLFWEAVWPRLFARGWHAVQPINNFVQNPKSLMFLVPGVAECSRHELMKGIHYFDSLSDVLSKVASEPELLELESDQDEPVGSDANEHPDNKQHQDYVEPDVPESDRDLNLFTIVDIGSDRDGDGVFKSMELSSLPVSEPIYVVEQGPDHDEQDLNEFCNNSENHLDLKRSECYNESKQVDDTGENIGFQVKTPSGNSENEKTVEPCSNRELDQRIIIDVNLFQMAPDSDPDQLSLFAEQAVNQAGFSNAGAVMLQQPVSVPQRQSTRSRMLSTKALEALAFGYLSPKKRRKRAEEKPSGAATELALWARGKNAMVSSGGARNVENAMDDPFSGSTASLSNGVPIWTCRVK